MLVNNLEIDKQIIDEAGLLVAGRGDGRISETDMEILLRNKYDTIERKHTLLYIYSNMNLTNPAKILLLEKISVN